MRIFDHLYSSVWMMTTVICVVMFVCVGLAFLNPFKNKFLNATYKVSLYLLAGGSMFSLMFFHFGFAHNFKKISLGRTTIFLIEEYETGGEGPPETVYRLHVVDKKTGERKGRIYIGSSSELLGASGDSVCYRDHKSIVMFNGATMKEVYRINEQNWGELHKDLLIGIDGISGNQNRDAVVKPIVEIACKNGKNYWMEPFQKTIYDKEPEEVYLKEFSLRPYDLCIHTSINRSNYYLQTQAVSGNSSKKIVASDNSPHFKKKESDEIYIEPYLMYIDTIKKFFVFGHYTTTDQKEYFIEAQDFDFKTIWKKRNTEFNATDSYNEEEVTIWKTENGFLYFNNGGFLIAMNPATSEIIWQCRL